MDTKRIAMGAVAGVAGGVVFGALMQAMGMMGMIAGLVGSESAAVGWGVHLVNSVVIGAIFGIVASRLSGAGPLAGAGAAYGVAWWVVGALLIMPLWLGMPAFQIGEPQLFSLMGHVIFGVVTGLTFSALTREPARDTVSMS
jgi:uncharacterized membrane protein YagU involved in acid resistance